MALQTQHGAVLHFVDTCTNSLVQLCCRQKSEDTLPSTSAGVIPAHASHQDVERTPQKLALSNILSRLTGLFSADMRSSNVLSSMCDIQCQLQAQLQQQQWQHHETA